MYSYLEFRCEKGIFGLYFDWLHRSPLFLRSLGGLVLYIDLRQRTASAADLASSLFI